MKQNEGIVTFNVEFFKIYTIPVETTLLHVSHPNLKMLNGNIQLLAAQMKALKKFSAKWYGSPSENCYLMNFSREKSFILYLHVYL